VAILNASDIAASSHEAVFGTDHEGHILMWNHGAERRFGRSAD